MKEEKSGLTIMDGYNLGIGIFLANMVTSIIVYGTLFIILYLFNDTFKQTINTMLGY